MYKCSICGKEFDDWGNNPYPVTKGVDDRCCDKCNDEFVIPARIEEMSKSRSVQRRENIQKGE